VAYDERLAERVRGVLPDPGAVREQKMFGGLAFMVGGHMFCGVMKDELMLRLGPDGAEQALTRPHVRPMDFTGRPMTSMVLVGKDGLKGTALRRWVEKALAFAHDLPPKPAKQRSARSVRNG
jgi:TfoX/Sxy family transcriptional regulator of competence genes